ncbi:hybrid sensor histidine kinase/response regulator [Croceivirga thetidis]|uniref:histidine kinase n=1 Tax=Croceivirga thetidis TaxID=2721623 RepID=A0ABX1GLX3_9FLAO|nr:ATP-binding protein [Croceivirga thetidis]NKI30864.1 response regulator [Croceivirga thetidis]
MKFEDSTPTDTSVQKKNLTSDVTSSKSTISENWKIDFNGLADHISEGLARCEIICDENNVPFDYRFLQTNQAFEKHTGLSKEFCQGKTILEIMPDAEQSWIDTYGRVALTLQTETITGYNKHTNRFYKSTAYSDKKGEFMMLFEDITHQKELEKAYELVTKSSQLNSDLIENMPDGFQWCKVIKDEENKPIDFRIIETNAAYAEQIGIDQNEITGKTFLELFPDVNQNTITTLCNVGITGQSISFVDQCNMTNRVFDISAFSPKQDEFVMFMKNITERERSRLELEKAYKKVEESEKLKTAFLANMSHEIRTPLNAIIGFSELLETDDLSTTEKQKCLKNIKGSGNRLLGIISDILDISKLEANQQELNFQNENFNDIIDSLRDQFVVINNNPTVNFKTSKPLARNEAYISIDSLRVQQIFSNLIENSLKHTESGSIEFGYRVDHKELECFVKDSGSGIHKNNQKLIFERFQQVKNKTGINSGTGLGIPIAAALTQLFGGKMWLDSEVGVGSTFFFTIPYRPQTSKNPGEKHTILVAEDEEANFTLLELWMSKTYNVIHAIDGNDAIEKAMESTTIDLILMDIKMPYLNGIEATKKIREVNKEIPIIAQTAFVMEKEKKEILDAGCNDIILKPIKREEFKKILLKYIPIP